MEQQEEIIDETCRVCRKDVDDEHLLLCDGCDRAYHTYCKTGCDCCGEKPKGLFGRKPPVPEGDWFCKHCAGKIPEATKPQKAKSCVYSWGSNAGGQLGLPDLLDEKVTEPTKVTDLMALDVAQIACGNNFTIVRSKDGGIYSCGNGCDGQLGHPDVVHELIRHFRRIDGLDKENRPSSDGTVTSVHCGGNFTIALTENGHAYTFGCGDNGQLGHQENKTKKVPKKISALKQMELSVTGATCGEEFVLMTSGVPDMESQFVTDLPGEMMAMGSNNHGQLGDGTGRNQWVPQLLNKKAKEMTEMPPEFDNETPAEFVLGRDIHDFAAGRWHSVAVTESGYCFSWGYGLSGQTGHPKPAPKPGQSTFFKPNFRVPRPRFIQKLRSIVIRSISCGLDHTLALTDDHRVYGWGRNECSEVGVENDPEKKAKCIDEPVLVTRLEHEEIVQIACGNNHSMALTGDGKLYSFGSNVEGQLGRGLDKPDPLPTVIATLSSVTAVFCGGNHTFAMTKATAKRPLSELGVNSNKRQK